MAMGVAIERDGEVKKGCGSTRDQGILQVVAMTSFWCMSCLAYDLIFAGTSSVCALGVRIWHHLPLLVLVLDALTKHLYCTFLADSAPESKIVLYTVFRKKV